MPKKPAEKKASKKKQSKKTPASLSFEDRLRADPALAGNLTHERTSPEQSSVLDPKSGKAVTSAISLMKNWVAKRKGMTASFKTLAEVNLQFLRVNHFALQYLFGATGIRYPGFCEFIAKESTGKTTMAFALASYFIDQGCQVVYIETEGKPMPCDRASRVMSKSVKMGNLKASRIVWDQVFNLKALEQKLYAWTDIFRGRSNTKEYAVNLPKETPLVFMIDTWSKLMSKRLTEGFLLEEAVEENTSKTAKSKVTKRSKGGVKSSEMSLSGEGTKLEHSQWAQDFGKRLPAFTTVNNVLLIMLEHQNDKISMSAGGYGGTPSFIPEEVGDLRNKTRVGGRAFNQNAQTQIIGVPFRQIKHGDKIVGKEVKWRVDKNSFGAESRQIRASIFWEHPTDSGDYQSPAFSMDDALCDILMDNNLVDLTLTSKTYTSSTLQLTNASAAEVAAAFHAREDLVQRAGQILKIRGYDTTADAVLAGDPSILPGSDHKKVKLIEPSAPAGTALSDLTEEDCETAVED